MNKEQTIEMINVSLAKIRPYIQRDGGDVTFVDYDETNGVVTVEMLGACAGCMALDSTLTDGIEAILLDEVPGVSKVVLKQPEPFEFF